MLRRITLHGFKSFADRLDVAFEPGITAIVGPNGSGKSNIADAVKWVLGESSARELRGSRMEDVIFAGSAGRRSLGLAEVTLTLDNADGFLPVEFAEVNVTRRFYRSGDSEFLLNHSACRLKDIQELFLDSGVGRNAYALLSQAEVEAVLSAHPEERRRLFEEAAGVAKFRAKKTEALRKLAETEQNLVRVGDILGELTSQLGPLAEKARRAERHAALSDELRQVEVALLAGLFQAAQRKVEAATEELTRREMAVTERLAALRRADALVVERRTAVAEADAAREEVARRILLTATDLERLDGEVRMARERQQRWQGEQADLEQVKGATAARLEAAAARVSHAEGRGTAEQEILAEARTACAARAEVASRAAQAHAEAEAELERQKSELIETMNEAAQLRNELKGLTASREAMEAHRLRLSETCREVERAVQEARAAAAEAVAQSKAGASAVETAQANVRRAEAALAEAAAQEKRLEASFRAGETELGRLDSRYQVLADWQRNREGYADGPRAILQESARGRLPGVVGTVAQLLHVSAELERAVETALGASLQDVVVEDEAVARRGIEFLKRTSAGRATFLPLALLAPRPLNSKERRELAATGGDGYLGVGDELVGYDPALRPAVEYLLGRVLVTRDLETALRLGRATGLRYLVVTAEGDLVRPGGAVAGGREERSRGLLRRQRELVEVEAERKKTADGLAKLRSELEALAARGKELEAEYGQAQAALRVLQEQASAAEREVAVREAELRQAKGALGRARADLSGLDAERSRAVEDDLAERLRHVEEVRLGLEAAIERGTAAVREAAAQREAAAEDLTTARVRLAEREKDAAIADAELERARAEAESAAREVAAASERAVDLVGRIAETEAHANQLAAERVGLGRQREELEEAAERLSQERAQAGEALSAAEAEVDRARLLWDEAQAAVRDAEVAAARAELEAENVAERLAADWGLSRAEALLAEAVAEEEGPAAAERAETLRRRLKALGTVDPSSVAEHAALAERHGFLAQQYEDLMGAREALNRVLGEIETATTRRFNATFTLVREEFTALFRRVFGGGRAELRLTDPDNPAESGIEVEVQPPGKKNQSLLSLSSGERTMTALALLFAMMRVRPAPFCVLDEVDAALDEANLDRFVELLAEFATAMQFIVITHRRRTMEAAGVLYGVTMEEPGTSRLVSVRLSEAV